LPEEAVEVPAVEPLEPAAEAVEESAGVGTQLGLDDGVFTHCLKCQASSSPASPFPLTQWRVQGALIREGKTDSKHYTAY